MIPLGSCTMKLNAAAEMEPGHLAGVLPSTRSPRPDTPGPASLIADPQTG